MEGERFLTPAKTLVAIYFIAGVFIAEEARRFGAPWAQVVEQIAFRLGTPAVILGLVFLPEIRVWNKERRERKADEMKKYSSC